MSEGEKLYIAITIAVVFFFIGTWVGKLIKTNNNSVKLELIKSEAPSVSFNDKDRTVVVLPDYKILDINDDGTNEGYWINSTQTLDVSPCLHSEECRVIYSLPRDYNLENDTYTYIYYYLDYELEKNKNERTD